MRPLYWYALAAALLIFGAFLTVVGAVAGSFIMVAGLTVGVLSRLLLLKTPYRPGR